MCFSCQFGVLSLVQWSYLAPMTLQVQRVKGVCECIWHIPIVDPQECSCREDASRTCRSIRCWRHHCTCSCWLRRCKPVNTVHVPVRYIRLHVCSTRDHAYFIAAHWQRTHVTGCGYGHYQYRCSRGGMTSSKPAFHAGQHARALTACTEAK